MELILWDGMVLSGYNLINEFCLAIKWLGFFFMKTTFFLFIFFFLPVWSSYSQDATFISFPKDYQLYTRNILTNDVEVDVSGFVLFTSSSCNVKLEVFRNEQLIQSENVNLVSNLGSASFNFSTTIVAELENYFFKFYVNDILIKEANNIVCGDVYIMNGQSNMVLNYYNINDIPATSNPFIRTYGSSPFFYSGQHWHVAFSYGGIAYKFANELITTKNIPVAIFNGSSGGQPISHFQRNDNNPTDNSTNYGMLLNRITNADIDTVRAIVFYQGETDAFQGLDSQYLNSLSNLYYDWKEDYNPEKIFIFQIKRNCGTSNSSNIPEYQRQFSELYNDVELISTNGVSLATDLCHYNYIDGYSLLGERLFNMVNYLLYNSASSNGIFSPKPINIRYSDSTKEQIKFNLYPETDNFNFENGVQNYFYNIGTPFTVNNYQINDNEIILNLNRSLINSDNKLSYLGPSNSVPSIKNQNNVGMINFKDLYISNSIVNSFDDNGWTYYYIENINSPFFAIEKRPTHVGSNNLDFSPSVELYNWQSPFIKTDLKEGMFCFNKMFSVNCETIINGTVNIRLFVSEEDIDNLNDSATNFKNSSGSLYKSDIIYFQNDGFFDLRNQLNSNGFLFPIKKCGQTVNDGIYNGRIFKQINGVTLNTANGFGLFIKVTNMLNNIPSGTLRFDSGTGKFQGWNGSNWVNFN